MCIYICICIHVYRSVYKDERRFQRLGNLSNEYFGDGAPPPGVVVCLWGIVVVWCSALYAYTHTWKRTHKYTHNTYTHTQIQEHHGSGNRCTIMLSTAMGQYH